MLKTKMMALGALLALFLGALTPTQARAADPAQHRIVIQIDNNNKALMNLVLNNAANVDAYYKAKGEDVQIEIVAYGPGLNMLRADKSPVKARIASFGENFDNIRFSACDNTLENMAKKEGKVPPLVPQAKHVPSGVVRISELQEQGWSYVRP
ncbi:DsrE family protein [Varunaivibrio sulfuroxidans]|uniref:Uncharacterized protein n=1 Tax=Varunaivibrio sulfuroxidans TaxID=1773489 RepID=A0A4R3JFX9_9PROT|nr:DsrE family protein [Varunaivibrio sulfuroxidans]TCS64782.1 hypothetical protein EDD55_101111 [Varunaivibrio sulfuroxidans]WES29913.1 DsrE family protein [Varunaivibrio sulfuroxidans]